MLAVPNAADLDPDVRHGDYLPAHPACSKSQPGHMALTWPFPTGVKPRAWNQDEELVHPFHTRETSVAFGDALLADG